MSDAATARSHGKVFNAIAAEYDRNRPAYPDELIGQALAAAALGPGDAVLEVGCGTGQLTRSLVARGLRVTAVDPGERLIALAAQNLAGAEVEFLNARLEDAELPQDTFRAVFAAASFHWIDPDVSWRRVAEALVPGGTLALLGHVGLDDPDSAADQAALMAITGAVAPQIAAEWPRYRTLDETLAGVQRRRGNVSEVWAWLGSHELARAYASELFEEAEVAAVPIPLEHTADQLNALLGTLSFWSRLSPGQRAAIANENRSLYERLGRPIRSSTLAILVTARRR